MKRYRVELKDWAGYVLCAQEVVLHPDMMMALFAPLCEHQSPGTTVRAAIPTLNASAPFSLQVTVL
jgi:hypothetical protein